MVMGQYYVKYDLHKSYKVLKLFIRQRMLNLIWLGFIYRRSYRVNSKYDALIHK